MDRLSGMQPAGAHADAEHWFARLRAEDCTAQERAAYARWRDADPAHAAAFDEVEQTWRMSVDLLEDPALKAFRAEAHRKPASLEGSARYRGFRHAAIAAGLVLAVGVAGYGWLQRTAPPPPAQYVTAVGEQRELALPDRSSVLLDTDSVLSVRFGRGERWVALERGRAQFSVAHDAGKPFVVDLGHGEIRVLGTRFQARRTAQGSTVLLLEGAVSVSAGPKAGPRTDTLRPGDELAFDAAGGQWHKRRPDLAAAQGWTQGDLVFDRQPLGEVLAEANRYAQTQVHLADPDLGDLPISGVFHAGDQQALVLALEHGWRLRARQISGGEIVLARE